MTMVVTGGAGFIGRHLVQLLLRRGERVRVVDVRPLPPLPPELAAGCECVRADISDAAAVRAALRGADTVYHLAANPQLWTRRRGRFGRVNYRGTVHVLQAACYAGVRRIVHVSTESILARRWQTDCITEGQEVPRAELVGPYCLSKWQAERYAWLLVRGGAPVVIINPTLPVGPGDWGRTPPTQLLLDCCRGRRPMYLDAALNWIDVRDAAAGIAAAAERGVPGRRYLLGAENWRIREVLEYVARLAGQPPPRWRVPYGLALAAAYVSEFVADVATGRIPAATVTGVKLTRRCMHFDASRSLTDLGVRPRPVRDSFAETVEWFRQVGWLDGCGNGLPGPIG